MKKDDSEKLPEVVKAYIDAVVRQVRYRKKVRAEVRQELEAHFADALHGCESKEERQKRAEALIAGFGDVKVLAKLIRRGKKRCRPLWRTLVVRAFQLLGVFFLLLVLYIGWFFSGKPIITTNYLEVLNTRVRPTPDESLNAEPFYAQAIKAYVSPESVADSPRTNSEFEASPESIDALTTEEQALLEQWLTANQKTVELIQQGNQKPYYWRTYATGTDTQELIALLVPDLTEYRKLAYLLCWQALWEAEKGHMEEAFGWSMTCYQLGKHVKRQTTLIEQLVGIAAESLATRTMRMLLDEHAARMTPELLNRVAGRFSAIVAGEDFKADFAGEKLFMYDEIQRSFTQSRLGGSHIYVQRIGQLAPMLSEPDENEWLGRWFQLLFTHPDREETLEAVDRFYEQLDKWSGYSPAQLRMEQIDIAAQTTELAGSNLFLSRLLPALEKVIQVAYRNKADSEATLAVLAILQYRSEHQKLPDSLQTLVKSGLIRDVPIDPYSNEPLVYRKTDGAFTLYSVGANFEDDGGVSGKDDDGNIKKWADTGDMVFWPAE